MVIIPDVGLEDPPWAGIVTLSPPIVLLPEQEHSWKPKSCALQESAMLTRLAKKIVKLSDEGTRLVDVKFMVLSRSKTWFIDVVIR